MSNRGWVFPASHLKDGKCQTREIMESQKHKTPEPNQTSQQPASPARGRKGSQTRTLGHEPRAALAPAGLGHKPRAVPTLGHESCTAADPVAWGHNPRATHVAHEPRVAPAPGTRATCGSFSGTQAACGTCSGQSGTQATQAAGPGHEAHVAPAPGCSVTPPGAGAGFIWGPLLPDPVPVGRTQCGAAGVPWAPAPQALGRQQGAPVPRLPPPPPTSTSPTWRTLLTVVYRPPRCYLGNPRAPASSQPEAAVQSRGCSRGRGARRGRLRAVWRGVAERGGAVAGVPAPAGPSGLGPRRCVHGREPGPCRPAAGCFSLLYI